MPTIAAADMTFAANHPSAPFATRGTLAVLSILALALAMAAFAWWYNWGRTQKCLALYGGSGANLIRTAPTVELLTPVDSIDISRAPGLIHARTSLLSDSSYLWSQPAESIPSPDATIRFRRGEDSIVLEFNFAAHSVRSSTTNSSATLIPKTAVGWQAFIERQAK